MSEIIAPEVNAQFTEEEEAFIEASMEVLRAADDVHNATEIYARAEERAVPLGQALGHEGREGLERTNVLTHEAAQRAGFDEDSSVVHGLDEAYDQVIAFLDAVDAAAAEGITKDENPVI